MTEEVSKAKKFRVNAKRFFLTYSQVPSILTPESVLSQLEEKLDFSEYAIGEEYHADGGKHFHAVLVSERRQDIRSVAVFDLEFEGETYPCHCEGVRNLPSAVKYACKSTTYITNMRTLRDGVLVPVEELIEAKAEEEGIDAALHYYAQHYLKLAVGGKSLLHLERYLRRKEALKRQSSRASRDALLTPFVVRDFQSNPQLERWVGNRYHPTLIMVGPASCGKTQYAKAVASENAWNMFIANHKEGLKDLNDGYDAIFLDDVSLESFDENALLALLETNDRRGLVHIFAFNRGVGCYSHPFDCSINSN